MQDVFLEIHIQGKYADLQSLSPQDTGTKNNVEEALQKLETHSHT